MAEKKDYTTVEHKKPYRYEEDGLHVTRGCGWSAPGCHLGCGVLLYTDDDGKLVKVEGDPENPFNQGRLCVRCLDLPEVVYSPDRILHPLKRDPKNRGKNQWEQIGWDEALDEIAGKILAAKEEYGPESVAFYSGTGRDIGQYITRLCWGFNSPNFVFMMSGQSCYSPRVAGCFSTSGSFGSATTRSSSPTATTTRSGSVPTSSSYGATIPSSRIPTACTGTGSWTA